MSGQIGPEYAIPKLSDFLGVIGGGISFPITLLPSIFVEKMICYFYEFFRNFYFIHTNSEELLPTMPDLSESGTLT